MSCFRPSLSIPIKIDSSYPPDALRADLGQSSSFRHPDSGFRRSGSLPDSRINMLIGTIVETYRSVMTMGLTNLCSKSPNLSHSRFNGASAAGQTTASRPGQASHREPPHGDGMTKQKANSADENAHAAQCHAEFGGSWGRPCLRCEPDSRAAWNCSPLPVAGPSARQRALRPAARRAWLGGSVRTRSSSSTQRSPHSFVFSTLLRQVR